MKINRLGALLILLVIIGGISSLYFLNKDKYSEEVEDDYWQDDYQFYSSDSSYDQYSGYIETEYEERIDSVDIYQNGVPGVYTIFTKQDFEVEKNTGKIIIYYAGPELKEYSDYSFYQLEKRVEGNTVIQKIQHVRTGDIYNVPLFEFWILGDSVTPKNTISALITTPNEEIRNSGACSVVGEEFYESDDHYQEPTLTDIQNYHIEFNFDKLNSELVNKLQNKSIKDICGKYTSLGYAKMFTAKNGILLFFPEHSNWSAYNIGGFISK